MQNALYVSFHFILTKSLLGGISALYWRADSYIEKLNKFSVNTG